MAINTELLYRGYKFRHEFGHLGEVRGFFPPSLNILALTATASISTQKAVCKILGMHTPIML